MNTSIDLQAPFSYALWPIIVTGVISIAGFTYFLVTFLLKKRQEKLKRKALEEEKKQAEPVKPSLDILKEKCLAELYELEMDLHEGKIDNREAYTKLSSIFRNFIYEATGMPAHKYVLGDFANLNNPLVYNLVNDYYTPEFSENEKGSIFDSIQYTKRAVEQWN